MLKTKVVVKKTRRVCAGCKKFSSNLTKGFCNRCYRKETAFHRHIFGQSMSIYIPIGDKNKASKFFIAEKKRIMKDLLENPRKWLGKVKKK